MLVDVPPVSYGRLQVDGAGHPVTARKISSGGIWMATKPGGALPAFAGIDSEMIAGLAAEHGPLGSRHTGTAAMAGQEQNDRGLDSPPDAVK